MKRFHMNLRVEDMAESTRFYSALFGMEPSVDEEDYKKWMVDDPFINLSIEPKIDIAGIAHVGLQASDDDELQSIYRNIAEAGSPTFEEGETECCFAHSYKTWTRDPNGIVWEAFYTDGQRKDYGAAPSLEGVMTTPDCGIEKQ